MKHVIFWSCVGLLAATSLWAFAGPADDPPKPKPEDVKSADAIIAALYDVISGPAGAARDWDRFRSLFLPGARLIPIAQPREGPAVTRVLTVNEFVEGTMPYTRENGFFEREISRKSEAFGHMVHAFSTYESRRSKDEAPFSRGINSIQLFYDNNRWWVVTVYWDSERGDQPLPASYLPK